MQEIMARRDDRLEESIIVSLQHGPHVSAQDQVYQQLMKSEDDLVEDAGWAAVAFAGGTVFKNGKKIIPENLNIPQPVLDTLEAGKALVERKVTDLLIGFFLNRGSNSGTNPDRL